MADIDKDRIISLSDLKPEELERARPDWNLLGEIRDKYVGTRDALEPAAQMVQATLRRAPRVHSVFYRIKDPDHLLAKILRKQANEPTCPFTQEDYSTRVTDLVGARVLHLFKEDWGAIHDFITATWEQFEPPTAKIRRGDDTKRFEESSCRVEEHRDGYRSVHYLVSLMPTKTPVVAEIQVRTIFEEAWSEIDHTIRYPHNKGDAVLNQFLGVFNRLAGSADEMGSFIRALETELAGRRDTHTREISDLRRQIDQLKIDASQKASLFSGLESLRIATEPSPTLAQMLKGSLGSLVLASEGTSLSNLAQVKLAKTQSEPSFNLQAIRKDPKQGGEK